MAAAGATSRATGYLPPLLLFSFKTQHDESIEERLNRRDQLGQMGRPGVDGHFSLEWTIRGLYLRGQVDHLVLGFRNGSFPFTGFIPVRVAAATHKRPGSRRIYESGHYLVNCSDRLPEKIGGRAARVGQKFVSDATDGRVNPPMPAMGPNVAGKIGSAVAAGVFLTFLR